MRSRTANRRESLIGAAAVSRDLALSKPHKADAKIAAARTSRVSRSALAPAKLIAMASSTPGKTCIGAHTRAEATLAA